MGVEPVPGESAAIVGTDGRRILAIADYHAGIESVLRSEGVELDSRAGERRMQLRTLLESVDPDRLVVLGDLVHTIGEPWEEERAELRAFFEYIPVPVTLIKGNHDGGIDTFLSNIDSEITVAPSGGTRIGDIGFVHGHTWPGRDVLTASTVCMGHEHPVVRLEDEVGPRRPERIWLRGDIDPEPFETHHGTDLGIEGELIVFPAFNDLSGGTWVTSQGREFLSPFLPEALEGGEAYLLDGTRLGPYNSL